MKIFNQDSMVRGLMAAWLLMIALNLQPSPAEAGSCTCRIPDIDTGLKQSEAVFVGIVTRVYSKKVPVQMVDAKGKGIPLYEDYAEFFEFEVERSWKGPGKGKVTLTTAAGEDCVFPHFQVGETHLIYAYANAPRNGFPGMGAGICNTRSQPIQDAYAEILFLDILQKKMSEPGNSHMLKIALNYPSAGTRELAIFRQAFPRISRLNYKAIRKVMLQTIKDDMWTIRRASALVLSQRYFRQDSQVRAELIRALTDNHIEVKRAAAWSLSQTAPSNPDAAKALFKKLRSMEKFFPLLHSARHKELRLMAEGLIFLSPEQGGLVKNRFLLVDLFRQYLIHPLPKMRIYGLKKLTVLSPENFRAEADIKRALNDPDPLVREVAKRALENVEIFQRIEKRKKEKKKP